MRTGKRVRLAKDCSELVLDRQISQCGIDCSATSHTILVSLLAAVRQGVKMLNTSLAAWDGLAAEKALVALLNEKTLELLHL
jgi:hypothetical protein